MRWRSERLGYVYCDGARLIRQRLFLREDQPPQREVLIG